MFFRSFCSYDALSLDLSKALARAEAWKVGIDLEREHAVCIPDFKRINLHTHLEGTELGDGLFYQR